MDTDTTTPTCTACGRTLLEHERGHAGCGACVRTLDRLLLELAGPTGLYARLATVLQPGTVQAGGRVSGSRTAPIPCRLEPLSLSSRGGIVTILQTWLVDWHEQLHYRHPRWQGNLQQQLDQAVSRIRILLAWAAENHEAFAEFAAELKQAVGAARAQVTGEQPARRVTVTCHCGAPLRITLDTPGKRCSCGAQYGWAELRQLPLAERSAA